MKSSWLAAAGVTLILVLWMASGLLSGNDDQSPEDAFANNGSGADTSLMRVEVLVAEPMIEERTLELRGEISAARMLAVRAETSGRVVDLPVERGARVEADAALAKLDVGTRDALLVGARAQLTSAQAEQQAAESLGRRGLQSQLQAEQALAATRMARAEVDRLERDIADTQVRAPFAGLVEQLPVEIGQLIERGDHVATLVDDSTFEVTARAAQQVAAELEPGQSAEVTLITGETLDGEISWVSSVADPATRSFEVEARIGNPDRALAAGVSATLKVPVELVDAVFLSPSSFTLSADGELGVKVLDADDVVVFQPVTVLRTSLDGAWVSGIEAGTRVVTLGQGFVRVGEQVEASAQTKASTGADARQ